MSERILIVDDDPRLVRFCSKALVGEGYRVQGAEGGEQALALLAKEPFDLALVDLEMPYVGGLEVLRRTRQQDPAPAMVAMTNDGAVENAIEALRAGARDFLPKPFELTDLLQVVERALAGRRLEQEAVLLRAQMPILKICQALMTQGDVQFLVVRLLETLTRQTKATRAWFLSLDERGSSLQVAAVAGAAVGDRVQIPVDRGIVAQALQGVEPLALDPAGAAASAGPAGSSLAALWGVDGPPGPVACLPLRTAQRTVGLAVLARPPDAHPFTPTDLNLLSIMGRQVAIALENARLYETVARMLDQMRTNRERLRRLTRRVVTAQEEERQRLSRELHDEAGQALTALKLSLELMREDLPPEAASLRRRMDEAVELAAETMDRIRLLAQDLRPPALDAVGLNAALEGYCHDFAARTGLSLRYVGAVLPDLPNEVRTILYRLLQEALTNVAKHANASRVAVSLNYDRRTIRLVVADNGRGFDPSDRLTGDEATVGIGLLGMQERLELLNGWLEIDAQVGQGARLIASIPWRENPS